MHADTLICSHPRSGGRWLRYLIAHYLAARHELDTAVTPQTVFSVVPDHHDQSIRGYPAFRFGDRRALPLVAVCHQPYSWEFHRTYPIVFLARNAYDVVVSAYFHLTREKAEYAGSMREFVQHPKLGLPAWIDSLNRWAPKLLTHRDATFVVYRELDHDPTAALTRVLEFIDEAPDPALVRGAVESGTAWRSSRGIRTGQEGNFWDHLQPEELFYIQETVQRELSDTAAELLKHMGVDLDPFPRDLP